MIRNLLTSGFAIAALAAAGPALSKPGGGAGAGVNVNVNAGGAARIGGPSGSALDARLNSMGSINATPMGSVNASPNSALNVNGNASRLDGRINSQGALNASARGLDRASANSVLKNNVVVAGPLAGLQAGTTVQFNGTVVGQVQRVITSRDGTVRRVLVIGTDGKLRSLSPVRLSMQGGLLVTTSFRAG